MKKSELRQFIREEIHKLNESKKLVKAVNNLEQFIWYKIKNKKVINQWDTFTERLMNSEEEKYWNDMGSNALQKAYDFGISLLKKYKIKYKG